MPKGPFCQIGAQMHKELTSSGNSVSFVFFLVLQLKYIVDVQKNPHNELVKSITI